VTDLSVVIVNWNTLGLLRNCLASLRSECHDLQLEVFVVDNGSSDGSQDMVRNEFPEAILIENKQNLGFAKANNLALRVATGKYLLLLNSDTVVLPDAFQGLMETMEQDPAIGIAGLQLLNEDGSLQNSISNIPSLATELGNKSLLRLLFPQRYPGKEHKFSSPIEVESVIGACMMVRRVAAEQVGWLDEDYFFFLEETDWCLRMRRAGWKVVHDPRYRIYHLQGKSAGKVNVRARIEYWRSRYTFFNKHYGSMSCVALRCGLLIRLLVNLLVLAVGNAASLFRIHRLRERFVVYQSLLNWHISGCPKGAGLSKT
jgi:GT2 family glycosyltransferase